MIRHPKTKINHRPTTPISPRLKMSAELILTAYNIRNNIARHVANADISQSERKYPGYHLFRAKVRDLLINGSQWSPFDFLNQPVSQDIALEILRIR